MTLYDDVRTFPYMIIRNIPRQKRSRGNPRKRNARSHIYKNIICAFDIETYNDPEIEASYMYVWQFALGNHFVIMGRTWEEYLYFLWKVEQQLDPGEWLMIFVHNLSFEFQFLKGQYLFQPDEVFCMDRRKILNCKMCEHFEYRCSFLQSNMSLAEFTRKMGVEHQKLSGEEYNYDEARYPWTVLSDREQEYCINDVLGLVEAMQKQMEVDGDNLYTVPHTSTGYVRRDVKRAMRHYNRDMLHEMLPDPYIFRMLREAFRGGNTHANRYYAGQILEDVDSWDRKSSYPDEQINRRFPMGPWHYEDDDNLTLDRLFRKIYKQGRAALIRVAFWEIQLQDGMWGCPYLSSSKCRQVTNAVEDNGRILGADYIETTITDIDLEIILGEYKWSAFRIYDLVTCRYGLLPAPYKDVVKDYFAKKTQLKGVEGQEIFYMKSKAKLNACYGMSVQDPGKLTIEYKNDDFIPEEKTLEEKLDEYNRTAFQSYAWGVWVAAWARYDLELAIREAHKNGGFVYCDTDSVKVIGGIDLSQYNIRQQMKSKQNGGVAYRPDGTAEYLGVYEHDAHYDRFVTLGAKKYAYEENGKLGVTISGVGKRKGAIELQKLGGLDAFRQDTVFREAGGLEAKYNDDILSYDVERPGGWVTVTSNVYLHPGEYTLGVTGDYLRILKNPLLYLDLIGKGLTAR